MRLAKVAIIMTFIGVVPSVTTVLGVHIFGVVFFLHFLMKVVDEQFDVLQEVLEFGVVDVLASARVAAF